MCSRADGSACGGRGSEASVLGMASLDEIKQEIKMRVDLVDLVRTRVELKKSGRDWKGLSPFTKEKSPSFVVHPHEQFYKCFSSGEAGDIFTFMMKTEGVDFMTALKMLAQRAGIVLEERWDRDNGNKSGVKKSRMHELMRGLASVYRELLVTDKRAEGAREYAEKRSLLGENSNEVVDGFGIGYAPNSFDFVKGWAAKNGFSEFELKTAGVVSWKEENTARWYDRFRDRLMFPIRDEMGRVIGFSGRIMSADAKGAKYVNSPETPVFKKSRVLFGLDLARKPMADAGRALVCEGQIDVIRCHQFGFEHSVASQGTALTEEHARILKRYVEEVVLVMDSDKAGLKAAMRSGEIFLAKQLAVKVVRLPEGEDPDSLLLGQGAEAFAARLETAVPFIDFQVDVLCSEHDRASEQGIAAITSAVLGTVVQAPSEVVKDQMLRRVAEKLDVPIDLLRKDLERMVRPKYELDKQRREERSRQQAQRGPSLPALEMAGSARPSGVSPLEEAVLEMAVISLPARGIAREHVVASDFADEAWWEMLQVVVDMSAGETEAVLDRVRELGEEAEAFARRVEKSARSLDSDLGGAEDAMQTTIIRLRQASLKRLRSQVERRLLHVDGETRANLHLQSNQLTEAIARLRQNERNWESAVEILRIYP